MPYENENQEKDKRTLIICKVLISIAMLPISFAISNYFSPPRLPSTYKNIGSELSMLKIERITKKKIRIEATNNVGEYRYIRFSDKDIDEVYRSVRKTLCLNVLAQEETILPENKTHTNYYLIGIEPSEKCNENSIHN